MKDQLLTDKECSKMLGIGRSTWWLHVNEGTFPKGFKLTKGTRRWKLSEILAMIEERSSNHAA